MLTLERLKERLHYCPESGMWSWRNGRQKGKKCGSLTWNGYLTITLDKKAYRANRLAYFYMTGEQPGDAVDHINGVALDNRWCNLRNVVFEDNSRNQKRDVRNTSGVTGVSPARGGKWRVDINHSGKQQYLGIYDSLEEAIELRLFAQQECGYHPNHGRTI